MSKEVEVLIIGAGVAGAVAASVLTRRGCKVAVVDKPGGASVQSSGAVNVAQATDHAGRPLGYVESARLVAKHNIYHPYSKVGEPRLAGLDDALLSLKDLASDVDFVLREDGRNLALATQLGTIKQAAMAQRSQAFDLSELSDGDSLLVIGFSGLPSFDARAVARTLNWSISNSLRKNVAVSSIEIEFRSPKAIWRSPMEMALAMDDEAYFEKLESQLSAVVERSGVTHRAFLIPAIAGRTKFRQFNKRFTETGKPGVYELLALPHSVPGARLNDAIAKGLGKLDAFRIEGEAMSAERSDGKVSKVVVATRQGPLDIFPKKVILASGRFLAGGFERQGLRREKVFGLPIWSDGKLIEEAHVATLSINGVSNQQPIFCAGLNVDERLRPYDRMMELFALNLFAAGSSLGGYDAGGVESGIGVAAFTGYLSAFHTIKDAS